MVESEWSIIIFSKYFKIQFAWPTFQKRSSTVMTIMSTHRKDKNVWGIPSMETYLTSIMIREKKTLVKRIFFTCMELHEYTEWRHWSRAAPELYIKTSDRLYCMTEQMSRHDIPIYPTLIFYLLDCLIV